MDNVLHFVLLYLLALVNGFWLLGIIYLLYEPPSPYSTAMLVLTPLVLAADYAALRDSGVL